MPTSRFALHGLALASFTVCALFLPLLHGLCAFLRPLSTPVSAAPSWPASQFTVCTSRLTRLRCEMFLEREFKETLAVYDLVLPVQACISFLRCVRQKWHTSVSPCSHRKAVLGVTSTVACSDTGEV